MRKIRRFLAIGCLVSMPVTCFAQQADPFGGGQDFGFSEAAAGSKHKSKTLKSVATEDKQSGRVAQLEKVAPNASYGKEGGSRSDRSQATLTIRAAMRQATTQTFIERPLEDALQELARSHDIQIVVNRRALEEIGITPDVPVTIDLKNVSLRSFLRLMLRDLDLTYMVKDEVLQITTLESAEWNLVVEMYAVPKELIDEADEVLMALTGAVVPSAWTESGGRCSITAIDNVLAVAATETIHEEVVDFLQKLQTAFQMRKTAK